MMVYDKNIDGKTQNLRQPREKHVESKLVNLVMRQNGVCMKFISPGRNGVPDRICLLPGGKIWFVETKKPGKILKPLQKIVHAAFEKLGFKVRIVSNLEQLKDFENEISAL